MLARLTPEQPPQKCICCRKKGGTRCASSSWCLPTSLHCFFCTYSQFPGLSAKHVGGYTTSRGLCTKSRAAAAVSSINATVQPRRHLVSISAGCAHFSALVTRSQSSGMVCFVVPSFAACVTLIPRCICGPCMRNSASIIAYKLVPRQHTKPDVPRCICFVGHLQGGQKSPSSHCSVDGIVSSCWDAPGLIQVAFPAWKGVCSFARL